MPVTRWVRHPIQLVLSLEIAMMEVAAGRDVLANLQQVLRLALLSLLLLGLRLRRAMSFELSWTIRSLRGRASLTMILAASENLLQVSHVGMG